MNKIFATFVRYYSSEFYKHKILKDAFEKSKVCNGCFSEIDKGIWQRTYTY